MKWILMLIVVTLLVGSFALYAKFSDEPTSVPSPPDASQVKRADASQLVGVTDQISTMSGTVSVKRVCDSISGCAEVYVNSTKVAANDLAAILGGYPSHKAPRWVVYQASSSGNAAPPLPSIVDVSMNPPFVVEDLKIQLDTIKLREVDGVLEVTGKSAFDVDKVGDPINVTLRLYAKSRIAMVQPYDGVTPFENFLNSDDNKPASEILADPLARKPLTVALGAHFKTFRDHVQVSNPAKLIDYRYIVGEGCVPHLCDSSIGIFIIDVATGRASGAWIDDGGPAHIAGERWRGDKDSAAYSALADWRSDHDGKVAKSDSNSKPNSKPVVGKEGAPASKSICADAELMRDLDSDLKDTVAAKQKGFVVHEFLGQRSVEEIYARFLARYDATSQARIDRAGKQPYGMISSEALALSGRYVGTTNHKVSEYITPPTPEQQSKDAAAAIDRAKKREADRRKSIENREAAELALLKRNHISLDCYATMITNQGILPVHYYVHDVEGETILSTETQSHLYYSDADIENALANYR